MTRRARQPFELSERQRTILEWVADGMTNAAIGRRLRLTEDAIKGAVSALCDQVGANSRTHLVRVAYDRGLLVVPVPSGGSDRHIAACFAARACPCRTRAPDR